MFSFLPNGHTKLQHYGVGNVTKSLYLYSSTMEINDCRKLYQIRQTYAG